MSGPAEIRASVPCERCKVKHKKCWQEFTISVPFCVTKRLAVQHQPTCTFEVNKIKISLGFFSFITKLNYEIIRRQNLEEG